MGGLAMACREESNRSKFFSIHPISPKWSYLVAYDGIYLCMIGWEDERRRRGEMMMMMNLRK
jgi:hypothetical protein